MVSDFQDKSNSSSGQNLLLWFNIILLVFIWFVAISSYGGLPARIPTHFNFAGKPDAWGNKSIFSFFLLPAVQTVLVVLILWLRKYPYLYNFPHKGEVRKWPEQYSRPVYGFLKKFMLILAFLLNVMFIYIQFITINSARIGELGGLAGPILILLIIIWIPLLVYLIIKINRIVKAQRQLMKQHEAAAS